MTITQDMITVLRHTTKKQIYGKLQDGNGGYCAIGLLASSIEFPPKSILPWFTEAIILMNDRLHWSFARIATELEGGRITLLMPREEYDRWVADQTFPDSPRYAFMVGI